MGWLMNKNFALRNLDEARESLDRIIKGLEESANATLRDELDADLYADVLEMYMKLNKVWNVWHASQEEIDRSTQEQFEEWCKFPKDIDISIQPAHPADR